MKIKTLLCAVLAGGVSLCADERPYQMGVEGFASMPTGTLRDAYTGSTGSGLALLLNWDLGNGHGLRYDLTGTTVFPRRTVVVDGTAVGNSLTSTGFMGSYTYHLNQRPQGPFVMAGLGFRAFLAEAEFPDGRPEQALGGDAFPTYTRYAADTGTRFAFVVGGGYAFNKQLGVTLRYQGLQSLGHTLATLEAGLSVRF